MRWSTSLVSVSGAMACLAACNPTNAATTTTRGPSSPVANPSVAVTPDTGLTDSQRDHHRVWLPAKRASDGP